MVESVEATKTTPHLINLGLIIITPSTIISINIRKSHDKPEADKTWPTFKTHLKTAQKLINRIQPTVTTD